MTITTNDTRNEYTATSGQTTFSYTFKIFADTELSVYQTAASATPDDTTDLITEYTVTGVGNAAGGTIVLTTGATLNDKITIVSNIAQSRTTDYQFNGDFVADTVNDDFDRTVSLVKQLADDIDRTPRFDRAVQGVSGVKIAPPVASEFLRWNVSGTDLESVSLNTVATGDNAAAISYSNTTSGLSATDVQGAVDEIITGGSNNITNLKSGSIVMTYNGRDTTYGTSSFYWPGVAASEQHVSQLVAGAIVDTYLKPTATTAQWAQTKQNNLFSFTMYGSTSGADDVMNITKTTGYFATLDATATRTKALEWTTSTVTATVAFTSPSIISTGITQVASHVVASLPAATTAGRIIYVSNETGGAVLAFSDGTNWRRVTDRAVVS